MTEARQFEWDNDGSQQLELTSIPTGDQIEHEDPLAVMHALLSRVVVLDYTTASRSDGGPTRIEVPHAFIQRSESNEHFNNGIYYVVPRISLAPEQEA